MSTIILEVNEVQRALSASGGAFVAHDKEVDIVRFSLMPGFADVVLDEYSALRVMYQRPGESQVRAQTLTYHDTDGLRNYYDWHLLSADLEHKGTITCALCILRADNEVEEWHTTPCQIRVLGSIHTDDSDEADESITPTVAQRVAVLESMIQRVASGAPIVVSSTSAMTDTAQIYVLSTDGKWYYYDGSAWVAGGVYGGVPTDRTLTQSGMPADAKKTGEKVVNLKAELNIVAKSALNAQTELINVGYIKADTGYASSSNNYRYTRYIPVSAGDVIYYKLNTFGSAIALYSEASYTTFVTSLVTGNETVQSGSVTIPSNGYIRAACNINYVSSAVLNFSVSILQKMTEADTALNDRINSANTAFSHTLDVNTESFNQDNYRWNCLHHDNFSREMTGWEIGQNSAVGSTANTYSWVTSDSYDDGLRVDDGASFARDTTRTNSFSLRKINIDLPNVWKVELNAPSENAVVELGFNVTNVNNFLRMYIQYTPASNRYNVVWQKVINGSLTTIIGKNLYDKKAKTVTVCYKDGYVYYYFDDELGWKYNIGDLGTEIYLCAFKSMSCHYDFINVFSGINKLTWNPNYILDSGDSTLPLLTTSANIGGYELQNDTTFFSDYADHFTLHSTDPKISHGIRAERSISTPLGINNLRDVKISFDVMFPSSSVEDESGDIFFQMHDRDGSLARTFVPMLLSNDNGHVILSIASTYAPSSTDITKNIRNQDIFTIVHDKWHHFDIRIKERYDSDQNPFTKIMIDGSCVFMTKVGNCFNDVAPSSPQYGIYKNVWDTGVTVRERYFDNLYIEY